MSDGPPRSTNQLIPPPPPPGAKAGGFFSPQYAKMSKTLTADGLKHKLHFVRFVVDLLGSLPCSKLYNKSATNQSKWSLCLNPSAVGVCTYFAYFSIFILILFVHKTTVQQITYWKAVELTAICTGLHMYVQQPTIMILYIYTYIFYSPHYSG